MLLYAFSSYGYNTFMAKEEVLKAAEEVLRAGDSYSLDWGLEKLLKIIKRNMEETAKALDGDYFPLDTVLPIAQCAREAKEYTGISSLSKALSRWINKHSGYEGINDIKEYVDEAMKEAENVPF